MGMSPSVFWQAAITVSLTPRRYAELSMLQGALDTRPALNNGHMTACGFLR